MRIITVVADGHGRTRIAATRAPDLWRREIAAQTGEGHLVWCTVAPADLGSRELVAALDTSLAWARSGPGYSLPVQTVIRTARRLLFAHRARRRIRAFARPLRRGVATLLRRSRRG